MSTAHRSSSPHPHWVVHMNRRNRTWSFIALFLTIGSHVWFQQFSAWLYLSLAVSFLLWPQLAYFRACQSKHSIASEINNLVIDSFIFGLWIAGLGFPLWITFVLAISISINLMVFRGIPGLMQSLGGLTAGIVAGSVFAGLRFLPDSHWVTTLLAVTSISLYLMVVGHVSFTRNQVLYKSREQQRLIQRELKQQIEANQQLQEQLQEQANRDPLTGLYNRRYLDDSLNREIARCLRQGDPLSLILIDLDHFKAVNDDYGHNAGDRVINQLAMVLTTLSRTSDIVCRFGGEEFLVVLPGTGLEAAEARAEEYRRLFKNTPTSFDDTTLSVTLSAGVACSYQELPPEELIRQADEALYRAKEAGRNRVVCQAPWTGEVQTA